MELTRYLAPDLLKGTVVFITGGGGGINLSVAHSFAGVGADVAICGRTEERLRSAADELERHGVRVCTVVADVRDDERVGAALEKARSALGPISTMVCGAAGNYLASAEAITSNGFQAVLNIDLLGSFHAAHAAFEQLKQTRGSLVFRFVTGARLTVDGGLTLSGSGWSTVPWHKP
jgi:NAD(P)-dependent dehydrogenase (short-subunit alcohol dehydrogenase family)